MKIRRSRAVKRTTRAIADKMMTVSLSFPVERPASVVSGKAYETKCVSDFVQTVMK